MESNLSTKLNSPSEMLSVAILLSCAAAAIACSPGQYTCKGKDIAVCAHGRFVKMPCGPGTACKMYGSTPVCAHARGGNGGNGGGRTNPPQTAAPRTDAPRTVAPNTDKPNTQKPATKPSGGGGGGMAKKSGQWQESAVAVGQNLADNLVSYDEFAAGVQSCGYPKPSQEKYQNAVGQAKQDGDISSKREFAMFLTEILWESDGLRATSEYRCATNNCAGEYKVPGCDAPGKFYFGRGYIQLTWCYNYKAASADLFGDDRLVKTPEKVASDDSLAWATAFWYWKKNVHVVPAVLKGHFGAATNAINGALECRGGYQHKAKKRFACYKKVFAAFNLDGSPIESGCYN